ncbi:hypothetical protein Oscil6304_4294 [Oscillatoria acuminata PCC 6304]|uniref:Uncharacterized protein n=1 Tax=Oscillatoria acuminata PCC 6304 TaxID=56110 RepID=K9TMR3_9CYAN|nr:hypothetical protein Oscil6304_4294 [Oscillatoria acuminata PCC 6304]
MFSLDNGASKGPHMDKRIEVAKEQPESTGPSRKSTSPTTQTTSDPKLAELKQKYLEQKSQQPTATQPALTENQQRLAALKQQSAPTSPPRPTPKPPSAPSSPSPS